MEISKRPHFNRRIVAFVLFLLLVLGYLALTLLVAPSGPVSDLAIQSPVVLLSHQAPKVGAAAAAAPTATKATGHAPDAHQR